MFVCRLLQTPSAHVLSNWTHYLIGHKISAVPIVSLFEEGVQF